MDITKPADVASLFSAKNDVIVITGGGTGIGLAIASALANTGAKKVYILGRRLEKLQDAAKPFANMVALQCDVTSPESIQSVVAKVKEEVGYVDALINNAGVSGPNHLPVHKAESIDELSNIMLSDWDLWAPTYAINTTAIVGVAAAFLPLLDAANARKGWETGKITDRARKRDTSSLPEGVDASDMRSAQIISVTSIASFNRHITAGLTYSSSKAGATHLGKMLATLLVPWGIRSNIIAPGIFPSEMTEFIKEKEFAPHFIPLGRLGSYEDMASTALYLVGRSGGYLNGAVQVPDGGRLSQKPGTY